MKNEQTYFEEAISLKEYMNSMQEFKEECHSIYEAFELPEDSHLAEIANKNLHVLLIAEDWCGDAMLNNPIMRKIAEATSMDVRVVKRDEDTTLIDRYLTNGGRAIPIYIFLNSNNEVVGKWGPRAPKIQQFVIDQRSILPTKEDPNFEAVQKEVHIKITNEYLNNQTFWNEVYHSIVESLLSTKLGK